MVIMATRQTGAVRAGKMGRELRAASLRALLVVSAHPSFPAGEGRGAPAGRTGAMRGGWVGAARPLRPPLPLADGVSDIIVDAPAHRVLVTTSSRVYILALGAGTADEGTGRTILVTTHDPTSENPCPCTGIGVYDTRTGRFVGAGPSVVDSGYSSGVVPDS